MSINGDADASASASAQQGVLNYSQGQAWLQRMSNQAVLVLCRLIVERSDFSHIAQSASMADSESVIPASGFPVTEGSTEREIGKGRPKIT